MPIDLFEQTMAITLSTSSHNGIRDSSSDFIPIAIKMPIKYGDGYWMHPKIFESLSEESKKACCDYYNFEERDVKNRSGAVINEDDSFSELDDEDDIHLCKIPSVMAAVEAANAERGVK